MLLIYVGHSSGLSWGSTDSFNEQDIAKLATQVRLPLAISFSCVNGYISYPGLDIMAEAFVKPAGKGAIGAWMPADIGLPSEHRLLAKSFVASLVADPELPLGAQITKALNALVTAQNDEGSSWSPRPLLSLGIHRWSCASRPPRSPPTTPQRAVAGVARGWGLRLCGDWPAGCCAGGVLDRSPPRASFVDPASDLPPQSPLHSVRAIAAFVEAITSIILRGRNFIDRGRGKNVQVPEL